METVEYKVELLPDELLDKAAECLKVMAHPIRLRIVNILMQGEYAVHEIAELSKTSANQTCEHLRLLKGHGLLSSERKGRTVYYKIASPQLPGLIHCIRTNCQMNEGVPPKRESGKFLNDSNINGEPNAS